LSSEGKGQGHWERKRKLFSRISSSKVDRFMSNQERNDHRSIPHISLKYISSAKKHSKSTIAKTAQKRAIRIIFLSPVKFTTYKHCLLLISTLCISDVTTFHSHSFKTFATHLPAFTTTSHPAEFFPLKGAEVFDGGLLKFTQHRLQIARSRLCATLQM